jgi:catechol 2,3-dioxygenase-like lactoylglutathione lyase family enzyme
LQSSQSSSARGEITATPVFLGIDHVDCRVRSLAAVEPFYDEVLPLLGLTEKEYSFVDADGEWHGEADTFNAVEYSEPVRDRLERRFIGFIEDPLHRMNLTRIAFRVPLAAKAQLLQAVREAGAAQLEESDDPAYPALFFEDPAGTRLELRFIS